MSSQLKTILKRNFLKSLNLFSGAQFHGLYHFRSKFQIKFSFFFAFISTPNSLVTYLRFPMIVFCSVYCVNVFRYNIQPTKKSYSQQFFILCEKLVFLFLPFSNLGAQIWCPQNWYTDLKLALDQPLEMVFVKDLVLS